MTARKLVALVAAVAAALTLVVAVGAYVRVRQLDAEADRIGRLWTQDQGNSQLVAESNAAFQAARAIEDGLPLAPVGLAGVGMLGVAVAVAAWPSREREDLAAPPAAER